MKWLTLEGKHVINELSLKCLNNFALKKADFKTWPSLQFTFICDWKLLQKNIPSSFFSLYSSGM